MLASVGVIRRTEEKDLAPEDRPLSGVLDEGGDMKRTRRFYHDSRRF